MYLHEPDPRTQIPTQRNIRNAVRVTLSFTLHTLYYSIQEMEGIKVYVPDPMHVWLPAVILASQQDNSVIRIRIEPMSRPNGSKNDKLLSSEENLCNLIHQERIIEWSDVQIRQTIQSGTMKNGDANSMICTPMESIRAHLHSNAATYSLPLQTNSLLTMNQGNGYDDMIKIDYLHEASILYNLRHRFFRKLPYTYTGNICIAINPYQWLNLYTSDLMKIYTDRIRAAKPPHVYAVSMEAFHHMKKHHINQSILVSGESGAGKTETTKIVMGHLATLATNANSKVIQQIIQMNPLLESFGNAKTVRNDNSSRFGKFTELQFSTEGTLVGANSRTYLLEKSRVTTQAAGELNFHIFYQLLRNANKFPDLELTQKACFRYILNGVDQEKHKEEGTLDQTIQALAVIGINQTLQDEIMFILAGILHLGQVEFTTCNDDIDTSKVVDLKPFLLVAKLLGVDKCDLERAICNRNVIVGREVICKPMTRDQAADCRDALAKSLYCKLFVWLVEQINEIISVKTRQTTHFIGILDIFGFEHFESNSFEQFCINYANEKFQQKFVHDVLKTVQIEYDEESISWSHITFQDNQDVLDLIEGRLGVLSFLNEESMLATGSDATFASKLGAVMANNPLLETPRLNPCAFTIHHYAGNVTYDATGFLDKHRDALLPGIQGVMSTSTRSILSRMFSMDVDAKARKGSISMRQKAQAQPRRATVGTQFKVSLAELMDKISTTQVHYVRCVKPNSFKSPDAFSHDDVVSQLRCAGVLEAIRVARSAYSSRLPHMECLKSFRLLMGNSSSLLNLQMDEAILRQQCEQMLSILLPNGKVKDYQVGLTRVYFGQGVLEKLETQRACRVRHYAVVLQNLATRYLSRRRLARLRCAAINIQAFWRGYVLCKRYRLLHRGVLYFQARCRGRRARKQYRVMRFDHSIIRFQAHCRRFLCRRKYQKQVKAAKLLQHFWRFSLVRKAFWKRMEKEKKYKDLGCKVARIQRKLDPNQLRQGAFRSSQSSGSESTDLIGTSSFHSRSSLNTNGILDESHEVITALHLENESLRKQLDEQEEHIQSLKLQIRSLRSWQQCKEVDDKVQKIAHRDQESKELTYLWALEAEYDRLRAFICSSMELPGDTGAIQPLNSSVNESSTSSILRKTIRTTSSSSDVLLNPMKKSQEAVHLLTKSAGRLYHSRSNVPTRGSARRVMDHWEEIRNFPPALHYTLGSVPWKRLLTDWAQGNSKKLDYMKRWLKNVLDGGPIVSSSFPMGVELKYVTPMMLDGFMQLIIPKLAERPNIQVHVHTKEFIGTSMRITLSQDDSIPPVNDTLAPSPSPGPGPVPGPAKRTEDFQYISILSRDSRSSAMTTSNSSASSSPRRSRSSGFLSLRRSKDDKR
uniref:Myosinlike protein putative n=1 Tax=Albugo laibachii Nc14 TaxID=890382 RepID=F0WDT2_9STRA|nr:myosinlike protein putative [Albugo laibachii Nc14]|eukprot:CCA19359.1 myosinlike protein putative [Albugo laibachii Nc14]